jgi:hypothetical protein
MCKILRASFRKRRILLVVILVAIMIVVSFGSVHAVSNVLE